MAASEGPGKSQARVPTVAGLEVEPFLEFAPDAIVGVDQEGIIVLVNQQAENLFGYARPDMIGQLVETLVPERFRSLHPGHRTGYFTDPKTRPMGADLELFGLRRNGTEFPAEISLSAIDTKTGKLGIAAVRDITDRQEAERKFEQFLEFAPDAILGVNRSGHIVLVNQQTERLFGYARAELMGKLVETLVPERFRSEHPRHRTGYFQDPRTRPMGAELDLQGLRKDGTEFPAEISLSWIDTEEGDLATVAVRDISARVDAEAERDALSVQLQHARSARLESIGQLAGGIAHDFNNLLGVIMNYADFASEELEDRPAIRDDVDEIRRAASQAADLTRQLLVFSRREPVKPEVLQLNAVVQGVEKLLRRTLGNHIDLHTDFEPQLGVVLADAGEIEQVLVNLAVNARDGMPSGGKLRIRTANVDLDAEYTRLHPEVQEGPHVELAVEDSGEGMSAQTIARAFEPFFTTKEKGTGTGLGLATVYGIVQQAGGSIVIYSEIGKGTVVKVYLPVSSQAMGPPRVEEAPPSPGRGERILVVEDEDAVRRMTVRILATNGYDVVEASGGAAGLEVCADPSLPIDLLLTDVIMPEMLGPEFADQAKAHRPDLRVLFMSGYMDPVEDSHAVRESLIEKPFSANALLSRVRKEIDG